MIHRSIRLIELLYLNKQANKRQKMDKTTSKCLREYLCEVVCEYTMSVLGSCLAVGGAAAAVDGAVGAVGGVASC